MDFSTLRAHTNSIEGRVDTLGRHSQRVAALARAFAKGIGWEDLAAFVGMLHDIGKALTPFQRYCVGKQALWREICLPIAGHHAGLASCSDLGLLSTVHCTTLFTSSSTIL
jgi:CRISPR/Cas system-associated endonuclease Cas3-HD